MSIGSSGRVRSGVCFPLTKVGCAVDLSQAAARPRGDAKRSEPLPPMRSFYTAKPQISVPLSWVAGVVGDESADRRGSVPRFLAEIRIGDHPSMRPTWD